MSVAPCVFPRCRDLDGNPRLTEDTICETCQRHYARLLRWLVDDFATLKVALPKPVGGRSGRGSRRVSFGHPAAWASDMLAEIAAVLNAVEDDVRDHAGHGTAPKRFVSEAQRVRHAFLYLDARIDLLCAGEGAGDIASELVELHRVVRSGLGLTRFVQKLPIPCPGLACQSLQLFREVGQVWCANCGVTFTDDQYPWLVRLTTENFVSERDRMALDFAARHAQAAAS